MKMNKPKKADYRKTLVRNPEKPVSRCKVTVQDSKTSLKDDLLSEKSVAEVKLDKYEVKAGPSGIRLEKSVAEVKPDKYEVKAGPSGIRLEKSVAEVKPDKYEVKAGPSGIRLEKYVKPDKYEVKAGPSGIRLDSPEPYSTLKLSKEIDRIIKPRKTKSCSDVDKNKLAVDEKVSRKVNIPYDKPIYKNLMPLTCSKVASQPVVASRPPHPQKDKEPVLSDFVKRREPREYYYLPEVKIEPMKPIITSNTLRLYTELHKHKFK